MPLTTPSSENLGDRNQTPPLRAVPASKLIAANVYISEGRDRAVIDRLVRVLGGWRGQGRSDEADVNSFDFAKSSTLASTPSTSAPPSSSSSSAERAGAALVHVFVDEPYNRTGFTIAGLASSSSSSGDDEEENERGDNNNANDVANDTPSTSTSTSPSPSLSSVPAAIDLLAREALALVDWRLAGGSHPAIGVVDHVAVHALFPNDSASKASTSTTLTAESEARAAARRVARGLGRLGVPTYLYGSASVDAGDVGPSLKKEEWRKLAEVRRALGYFGPSAAASKEGGEGNPPSSSSSSSNFFARFPNPLPRPDAGPAAAEASKGAAAVGSVPWVMNVNVPLVVAEEGESGNNSSSSFAAAAASVARAVSARRGTPISKGGFALPGIEALALSHMPGIVEVACNLTDGSVRPAEVALAVEGAARQAGLAVQRKEREKKSKEEKEEEEEEEVEDSSWYVTGKRPEEVAVEAARALGLEIV